MQHSYTLAAVRAATMCGSIALLLSAAPVAGQGIVTTVAGSGTAGTLDGPAAMAQLNGPHGLIVDGQGNCYVSDSNNNTIRLISAGGMVSTIAGNGGPGYFNHPNALLSEFTLPYGLTLDLSGNLFVADGGNGAIRKLPPSGGVTTWAGNGQSGYQDGLGPMARFNGVNGMTSDVAGNLYVADGSNFRIRRVDATSNVTTLAGSGVSGVADGPAATAQFREPSGIARDGAGNLYIADRSANRIRKLSPAGVVSTYAGTGVKGSLDGPALTAQFSSPTGLAIDAAGNLYVLDRDNPRIRRIDASGTVTTIAGTGVAGFADGPAAQARFNIPYGLCLGPNGQDLYIGDSGNHRIRRLALGPLAVVPGQAPAEVSLFPNPAAGRVQVVCPRPATKLVVMDVLGRVVALKTATGASTAPGQQWLLDVSAWPAGLYLCRIIGDTFTQTQRLLVKD